MTEAALGRQMDGATGVAHFFTDVRIVRDDLAEAEPGEPGQVVIAHMGSGQVQKSLLLRDEYENNQPRR